MMVFWVVVGSLVGAALLFVLPPLFKRNDDADVERSAVNVAIYKNQLAELDVDLAGGDVSQEQYDKSRQEIERRLLEEAGVADQAAGKTGRGLSMGTAAVVALAMPVVAVMLYLNLGNPGAINPESMEQQATAPHGDETNMAAQIEMMVAKLSERLQQNPSDIEGWVMLGRSYSVLGRYPEAVSAYEKSIQFVGEDANLLTDYADALAMVSGESLEGKPLELLQKALRIDPNNQKALWLIGTALFERGDFTGAINYWTHLQQMLPPGSEDIAAMETNIAEAKSYRQRQLNGEFGRAPETLPLNVAQSSAAAASVPARVSGKVSLNQALQTKVAPNDTLFIFAKAVSGPQMPLAIIRAQAGDLPVEFSLDETMAMMPTMSLARFDQVVVGARISKSGNATPQSGDLLGVSQPVAVGSSDLEIRIDTVVP